MKKKMLKRQRDEYRNAYQEASSRSDVLRQNLDSMRIERDAAVTALDEIRAEMGAARHIFNSRIARGKWVDMFKAANADGCWDTARTAVASVCAALDDENVHLRRVMDDILGMVPWADLGQDGGRTP